MTYQRAIVDEFKAVVEFPQRVVTYHRNDCNGWENLLQWITDAAVDHYHTDDGIEYVTGAEYWSSDVVYWMQEEARHEARKWRRYYAY